METEHIVMDEDLLVSEYSNSILSEDWVIECSCSLTFANRLLSVARAEWRSHAGITGLRFVNDANSCSK